MATNLIPLEPPRLAAIRQPRSEPRSAWYADIAKLEARLLELQPSIITNQYEVGKIIHQLHERFPHGHWIGYRAQMCQRVGICPKSAHNYEQAYLTIQAAGGDELVSAATLEGLNLNKEYVRQVLAVAASEHPDLPAGEVVKLVKFTKVHKNPAVDQLATLKKLADSSFQLARVGKGEMVDFEVWKKDVPASKVKGRGSDRVNVMMSYAQLRTVKGNVWAGVRGDFEKAKRFVQLHK